MATFHSHHPNEQWPKPCSLEIIRGYTLPGIKDYHHLLPSQWTIQPFLDEHPWVNFHVHVCVCVLILVGAFVCHLNHRSLTPIAVVVVVVVVVPIPCELPPNRAAEVAPICPKILVSRGHHPSPVWFLLTPTTFPWSLAKLPRPPRIGGPFSPVFCSIEPSSWYQAGAKALMSSATEGKGRWSWWPWIHESKAPMECIWDSIFMGIF